MLCCFLAFFLTFENVRSGNIQKTKLIVCVFFSRFKHSFELLKQFRFKKTSSKKAEAFNRNFFCTNCSSCLHLAPFYRNIFFSDCDCLRYWVLTVAWLGEIIHHLVEDAECGMKGEFSFRTGKIMFHFHFDTTSNYSYCLVFFAFFLGALKDPKFRYNLSCVFQSHCNYQLKRFQKPPFF